jgi:dephospho-CoA kinase
MATVTRVGIAGYMGAGKSTCARSFESGGALLIDADAEAKAMMAQSREIRDNLRRAFGDAVVGGEGLRFDVLGRLAFKSAESLRKLNAATHPPLVSRIERLVRGCEKPLCVLDAALIPLFNIESWFDLCVWVEAPFEVRYSRLKAKLGGMDESELARRMRLQEEVMPAPAAGRWAKIPDGGCREHIIEKLRGMGVDKNILEPPAGSAALC